MKGSLPQVGGWPSSRKQAQGESPPAEQPGPWYQALIPGHRPACPRPLEIPAQLHREAKEPGNNTRDKGP